jgi:putative methionine-R-sulfoxide reductase with GAF domain
MKEKNCIVIEPYLIKEFVEPLHRILSETMSSLAVERGYIGFLDHQDKVEVPPGLSIPSTGTNILRLNRAEGLTGKVMEVHKVIAWPEDKESNSAYRTADPLVKAEIAADLAIDGTSFGALWLDSLDETKLFAQTGKDKIAKAVQAIVGQVRDWQVKCHKLDQTLEDIVKACLITTGSNRGYIALKSRDGGLVYFKTGVNSESFLELSQLEGLCGQVLQTGTLLNVPDVRSHPHYLSSDDNVLSEIICPILDDGLIQDEYETEFQEHGNEKTELPNASSILGIINMESYKVNAYDSHLEDIIRTVSMQTSSLARLYYHQFVGKGGPEYQEIVQLAIRCFFITSTNEGSIDHVESSIINEIGQKASQVLKMTRWTWIAPGHELQSFPIGTEYSKHVRVIQIGPNIFVIGDIYVEGVKIGSVSVECTRKKSMNKQLLAKMEQLCRVGEAFISKWRREYRTSKYLELLYYLRDDSYPERALVECVRRLPIILDSRHITIFAKYIIEGETVLVPGPSSSESLFWKDGNTPYYKWQLDGGVTSYVGVSGKHIIIEDLSNKDELKRISEDLTWQKVLAENIEGRTRAFMAIPLKSPNNPDEVIGVIRTFRTSMDPFFTVEEQRMMFVVASRLNSIMQKYIVSSSILERNIYHVPDEDLSMLLLQTKKRVKRLSV